MKRKMTSTERPTMSLVNRDSRNAGSMTATVCGAPVRHPDGPAYNSFMPIYEFRCGDCGQAFDRLLPFDAAAPPCPSCGGVDVRRMLSVIAGLRASSEAGTSTSPGCGCGGA